MGLYHLSLGEKETNKERREKSQRSDMDLLWVVHAVKRVDVERFTLKKKEENKRKSSLSEFLTSVLDSNLHI